MSTEDGEGITFSVPPLAPSVLCAFAEGGICRTGGAVADGEQSQPPPPGSFWNVDSAATPGASCPAAPSASSATRCRGNSGGGGGRRTTVVYVVNEESQGQLVVAESEALQSLREACETVGATLETLHFGELDFGETTVLDRFYNAGVVSGGVRLLLALSALGKKWLLVREPVCICAGDRPTHPPARAGALGPVRCS